MPITNFLIALALMVILSLLAVFGGFSVAREYFADASNKDKLRGILGFVGLGLATALIFYCADTRAQDQEKWFAYTQVRLGLDTFTSQSPNCESGGPNDRITSNGGITQNIFYQRKGNTQFEWNVPWTHHSCAVNSDRNNYDGIGVELRLTYWW